MSRSIGDKVCLLFVVVNEVLFNKDLEILEVDEEISAEFGLVVGIGRA